MSERLLTRPAAVAAAIMIVLMAVLAPGSPASAHTELESSSPADGATETSPVSSVSLTFNQGVEPTANPVQVLDEQGRAVATTGIELSPDRTVVTARTLAPLANGRYGVAWEVGERRRASGVGHVLVRGRCTRTDDDSGAYHHSRADHHPRSGNDGSTRHETCHDGDYAGA